MASVGDDLVGFAFKDVRRCGCAGLSSVCRVDLTIRLRMGLGVSCKLHFLALWRCPDGICHWLCSEDDLGHGLSLCMVLHSGFSFFKVVHLENKSFLVRLA